MSVLLENTRRGLVPHNVIHVVVEEKLLLPIAPVCSVKQVHSPLMKACVNHVPMVISRVWVLAPVRLVLQAVVPMLLVPCVRVVLSACIPQGMGLV